MTNVFYLEKSIDPFADTLAGHGLAEVVRKVLDRVTGGDGSSPVRLEDCGGYSQIVCDRPINAELIAQVGDQPLYLFPAIETAKNADSLGDLPTYMRVSYEAKRDERSAYFDWLNALPNEARIAYRKGEGDFPDAPDTPYRYWDILRAVNPAALIGYNKLALNWWTAQQALPQVLAILFELYGSLPNDIAKAVDAWNTLDGEMGWGIGADITALQLFNPGQGKGQNRTKSDRLSMGNVSGFWLVEWLKVVGFYQAALTRRLRTGDRKSYVLSPRQINLLDLSRLMNDFDDDMRGSETAIRIDILAALRFTQKLLTYAEANRSSDLWGLLMKTSRPRNVVSGFHSVFYKDLGNAEATMNLSHIALPGWVEVHSPEDVQLLRTLLEEHERIIYQFDESHGDEMELLQTYRDFLSGDDLKAFFAFTRAYASFIIGRRERNLPARQLTTTGLERLLMSENTGFLSIVQNEGFQKVAYAIRQSTVTAQYRKKQGDRRYDVRYGLNQELARTAHQPEKFIAALSEFMSKYNAENAQVMEHREGPYRTSLFTEDIEQIVWLVDEHGSEVICNLLIAYGYARVSRDDQDENNN